MATVRMAAPYTGIVHTVDESRVAARLANGYRLIGDLPEREAEPEPEPKEPIGETPTAQSTIAEIRAYAKANGIDLPKGNKKALLEALGVA